MVNDLFGGLGGLMKGLSSFMPQDDPAVKLMNAQSEVADLQKQEDEIFIEIGKQAYAQNTSAYPQSDKLKLIQSNLVTAQAKLQETQQENQATEKAKETADNARRCPTCSHYNPEGVSFCQECGTKLGAPTAKSFCTNCGQENPPGTKFCGGCGSRMGD